MQFYFAFVYWNNARAEVRTNLVTLLLDSPFFLVYDKRKEDSIAKCHNFKGGESKTVDKPGISDGGINCGENVMKMMKILEGRKWLSAGVSQEPRMR